MRWLSLIVLPLLVVLARASAAPVVILPPSFAGAAQPQVAVSPGGAVHVTFGKGNAVYHSASVDGGRSFSPPGLVGELPKLALGLRRGPRIVAGGERLVICAISHEEGDLHSWSSADSGATWQAGPLINDQPKSAREGLDAMAGDGRGFLFAVWLDDRTGRKALWGAASRDGGDTWGKNIRLYESPDGHICECCQPSVAVGAGGHVVAMWRNWLGGARDLYLTESADGGATFCPARKLGSGTWKLNGCPMDGGSLALDALGQPLTVWRREAAIFSSASATIEQRLAEPAAQPVIIIGRRGPIVLWQQKGGLMVQRGTAPAVPLAEQAAFPALTALPDSGVIAVWESTAHSPKTLLAERLED